VLLNFGVAQRTIDNGGNADAEALIVADFIEQLIEPLT
jgi:hypothetical protein